MPVETDHSIAVFVHSDKIELFELYINTAIGASYTQGVWPWRLLASGALSHRAHRQVFTKHSCSQLLE